MCFHHKDPKTKDFEIGDSCRFSLEKLKEEVDKCQLLCSNCHQGLHSKELIVGVAKLVETPQT